jgi:UDP-N-acetylmuramoyl-tripeptide--D-alanyl-D-alanine ligase
MICSMRLSALGRLVGGRLIGDDVEFSSISIDSREVKSGDLYLAISGASFDGNDYAQQAVENGASAAVISKEQHLSVPMLTVSDTQRALAEVAGHCRNHFQGEVLAITGSSGKTTTRKMLAAIMSTQGQVCSTKGNQNNEIGVPLTLLNLTNKHKSAVIEVGARKIGDISYLGKYIRPSVAILLNAGEAHIGEFGGYDNIVKAKGEIYQTLIDGGIGIVNADDPAAPIWLESLAGNRVFRYGMKPDSSLDVTAFEVEQSGTGLDFTLSIKGETRSVKLAAPGLHNLSNALAAASAAHAVGVGIEDVSRGLTLFEPESGRQSLVSLTPNLTVLDDSYNANPSSMKAALNVLALQDGMRVAVLGEMGELGDLALAMHLEIADYAAASEIENIWLIGAYADAMAEHIGSKAKVFTSKSAIAESLAQMPEQPVCVLLKASRFVALEEVIDILKRGLH